jgi:DNA-binding transcriptional ArsR family regulator
MDSELLFSALASDKRLAILAWLKAPRQHFPPQVEGDVDTDGVCNSFIADKLGVSAATASVHLRLLTEAGLIRPKRMGKWTYYKRVDGAIERIVRSVETL